MDYQTMDYQLPNDHGANMYKILIYLLASGLWTDETARDKGNKFDRANMQIAICTNFYANLSYIFTQIYKFHVHKLYSNTFKLQRNPQISLSFIKLNWIIVSDLNELNWNFDRQQSNFPPS